MKLLCRGVRVLTDQERRRIAEAGVRTFRTVPLRAQGTPELRELLREFGYQIQGDLVRFPEAVVDKVLDAAQEARDQNPPGEIADVPTAISYSASGQALWCSDPAVHEVRPAARQDLAGLSRVIDAIPRLGRAHPTFIPQDVPRAAPEVHAFATILLNSSRPHRVSVYSAAMLPYFIELMLVVKGGIEAVKQDQVFATKLWANSPFMMTRENIVLAMKARELLDHPLEIATMPVAGASAPVTLAGALAQTTGEVLACNAVSLAVDGRLVAYCAGCLTCDMRTGVHTQSGPDVALLRLGAAEMGAYVFGGTPVTVGGPSTAAKCPGPQVMMEKSLDTM